MTPRVSKRRARFIRSGVPVLGICYGMQTMAAQLGGQVEGSSHREFGAAQVRPTADSPLLDGLEDNRDAQGRRVARCVDESWRSRDRGAARDSRSSPPATTRRSRPWPMNRGASTALQFHPEVTHTLQGGEILRRFVREIAGCARELGHPQYHRGQRGAHPRSSGQAITCCWGSREASIPPCWPRCCIGPSAPSSPAYSSIMDCCAWARAIRSWRLSPSTWVCMSFESTPSSDFWRRWPAKRIRRRSAKSSAGSSSRYSTRKRRNSRTSSGSRRARFIRT